MDHSTPLSPVSRNFSIRKQRAQNALAETTIAQDTVQENENRHVLTNFHIFDFTDMEELSAAEVAAFSEIILCFSDKNELTSRNVLTGLRDIFTKGRQEWSVFELETGNMPKPEDEPVFWFMFWDKYQPRKELKVTNPTTLIKIVSYHASGFKNVLNQSSIDLDGGGGIELSCAVCVAAWLQTSQNFKASCSFNTTHGTDSRKRQRTREGAGVQHHGAHAQPQALQQSLEQMTAERDKAVKNRLKALKACDETQDKYDVAREEHDKTNAQCTKLKGLLRVETTKSEPNSSELEDVKTRLRDNSLSTLQVLRLGIRRELNQRGWDETSKYLWEYVQNVESIGLGVDYDIIQESKIKDTLEDVLAVKIKRLCSKILSDWETS